jgi:hypothetical protein
LWEERGEGRWEGGGIGLGGVGRGTKINNNNNIIIIIIIIQISKKGNSSQMSTF